MKYKYPPLYKYIAYFVIIYMFFRHQKILPKDKMLVNSLVLSIIVITLDYLFIERHPVPTDIEQKSEPFDDIELDDMDLDNEFNDEDDENIYDTRRGDEERERRYDENRDRRYQEEYRSRQILRDDSVNRYEQRNDRQYEQNNMDQLMAYNS